MEIHVYTGPLCGFNEYINSEVKEISPLHGINQRIQYHSASK